MGRGEEEEEREGERGREGGENIMKTEHHVHKFFIEHNHTNTCTLKVHVTCSAHAT